MKLMTSVDAQNDVINISCTEEEKELIKNKFIGGVMRIGRKESVYVREVVMEGDGFITLRVFRGIEIPKIRTQS